MKKSAFLAFILTLSLLGLLWGQRTYASPYTDIDVVTAYDMIMGDSYPYLVILDVRSQAEYDSVHIGLSVLIPHTELESRIGELDGNQNHEIIVYCGSGGRSVTASEILDAHGFAKIYNMLGGITAWMDAGYPIITQYTSINVHEAFDMITGDDFPQLIIIDAQGQKSFEREHIEGAINIPYNSDSDFGNRIFPLLDGQQHHEIIVYCSGIGCSLAGRVCNYLANNGFSKVFEMVGGINSWKSEGYLVVGDTTPPAITIISPYDTIYETKTIPLIFRVNETISWIGYSLDGQTNITITSATNLSRLDGGPHTLTVYAEDVAGNVGTSEAINFVIEASWELWFVGVIAVTVGIGFASIGYITYILVKRWHARKNL